MVGIYVSGKALLLLYRYFVTLNLDVQLKVIYHVYMEILLHPLQIREILF